MSAQCVLWAVAAATVIVHTQTQTAWAHVRPTKDHNHEESTATATVALSRADSALRKIQHLDKHLDRATDVETIEVLRARQAQTSASSIVRTRDLILRPRLRPGDLLTGASGLTVVQHAGGGKANQYFIRGFDADHGTDLTLTVDGIPVNMVSHGHGQGYADMHFVIPELVDRVEVQKGPHATEIGDFGTAGAVNLVTKTDLQINSLTAGVGMFETYRSLVAYSPDLGNAANVFAAEAHTSNGPFVNGEQLQRFNVFARSVFDVWDGDLTITLSGYTENGLFFSPSRQRRSTVTTADVIENSVSAYAKTRVNWTSWLTTEVGVRGDVFHFDVDANSDSGDSRAAAVSPKAQLTLTPFPKTNIFAKFGLGFHSNDARVVVRADDAPDPLTTALGVDVGFRTRLFDRLDLSATAYLLDLDSEIVFVGDEGTTEASGETRRIGLEMEARLRILSWLYADMDVVLNRARFVDAPRDENEVPLAPRFTLAAGLSAVHPGGYFGRIGLFRVNDRPASEDGFVTAQG